MYLPKHFEESRLEILHALIRRHPLATVVIMSDDGLNANHIPLHLVVDNGSYYGHLCGHVARANPLLHEAERAQEVLAIFQSSNAYISPSWYATKAQTGKVVPTWNYAAVHAYGTLRVIDDPIWIRRQLDALTRTQEAAFAEPWAVADAPAEFTEQLITQIVGIEIVVTRLLGKWKVSQNQSAENRAGVIVGLNEAGKAEMAELVSGDAKRKL